MTERLNWRYLALGVANEIFTRFCLFCSCDDWGNGLGVSRCDSLESSTPWVSGLQKKALNEATYTVGWKAVVRACVPLLESCPTLHDPADHSPPGSSVHGVLRARILEWVAMPLSREFSWLRDWTRVFCGSYFAGRFLLLSHWGSLKRGDRCHELPHCLAKQKHSKQRFIIVARENISRRLYGGAGCQEDGRMSWIRSVLTM